MKKRIFAIIITAALFVSFSCLSVYAETEIITETEVSSAETASEDTTADVAETIAEETTAEATETEAEDTETEVEETTSEETEETTAETTPEPEVVLETDPPETNTEPAIVTYEETEEETTVSVETTAAYETTTEETTTIAVVGDISEDTTTEDGAADQSETDYGLLFIAFGAALFVFIAIIAIPIIVRHVKRKNLYIY